ncbi:acyl-CoA dehydrogenase family protein [Streptomyces sp. NPDC093105]|uniref:acyl-CoA dehydrogenase family protein n=1 Tax=Streptomyces sp. NPDC093105 TaxID=3366029 RepID=UPI00381DE80A
METATEEQREIRRALRDLLDQHAGPPAARTTAPHPEGYDPALWARMSGELGLARLALPELALACEETGRALAPTPLLATAALTAPLVAALGTPAQRADLLPRIADGSLTCALAVPGGSLAHALGLTGDNTTGAWSGDGRAGGVQARPAPGGPPDGRLLYGEADQVLDGHSAGLLLVAAHTGGFARSRTLLHLVRTADAGPGLVRTRHAGLDPTRSPARVQLRDVPAELLGEDPADPAAITRALAAAGRTAAVLLAAEAAGAARAALDGALRHAAARDRHRLADLHVQIETARTLTHCAAREPGPGPESGPLALAQALDALRAAAAEAVPPHDADRYGRRAAADELLFGPAGRLRARAAERTGLLGEAAA